jgi:hypothetical protein
MGHPPALPAEAFAGGIAGHGSFRQPQAHPVKVQPPLVPAKRGGHAAELSNSAAESLRDTAEGITDPAARSAGTAGSPRSAQMA